MAHLLSLRFQITHLAGLATLWVLFSIVPGFAAAQSETASIHGELNHPLLRRFAAAIYLENANPTDYESPTVNPVMDQINLTFTPHVLPVQVGSTIDFPNSDETRHNVYTSRNSVCQFELGIYPAGVVKQVSCHEPGIITVLCNVHAEMRGFVVVSPTPYFTTTTPDGDFEIADIEPGTYRVVFEHERLDADSIEIELKAGDRKKVTFGKLGRKRR